MGVRFARVAQSSRRRVSRTSLLLALAILALPCAAAALGLQADAGRPRSTAAPASRPDESIIVSVPATAPWTETGIVVRAGDRVDLRAWGRVIFKGSDGDRPITPVGTGSGGGCGVVVTDAAVPVNAVVANIAPNLTFDGRGFLVGTWRSVTVPVAGSSAPEGRLFVGINHPGVMCDRSGYDSWEFRNNSSGAFTVEIAIRRKK
jgi:hypothetical protein